MTELKKKCQIFEMMRGKFKITISKNMKRNNYEQRQIYVIIIKV